jgi:hypothetical protein
MSIPEFLSHFGTEAQCAQALKGARWPQGFCCPKCSSTQHYLVGHAKFIQPLRARVGEHQEHGSPDFAVSHIFVA